MFDLVKVLQLEQTLVHHAGVVLAEPRKYHSIIVADPGSFVRFLF